MNKHYFFTIAFCWVLSSTFGQNTTTTAPREKIAVLSIDTKGLPFTPEQMGDLLRMETNRLGIFEVLDQYDIGYIAEKEQLDISKCFGKICLLEVGKKLGVDKMLSGSVNQVSDKIIVSLKMVDIKNDLVEKNEVTYYLNIPGQVQLMLELSLRKLLGLQPDEEKLKQLTQNSAFETPLNVPETRRLNLSGPRMGCTIFTGDLAGRIKAPLEQGGLDGTPVMFQFGYQFETTYLNQGGLQALFEFIPVITGFDQGQFIPSINIMHGLRSNKSGWEFAFGPNFSVTQTEKGFFDANGQWQLLKEWTKDNPTAAVPNSIQLLDTRGIFRVNSGFIFAFGRSFRSGRLNIPVNAFFVPNKYGNRFGISFGFNARG